MRAKENGASSVSAASGGSAHDDPVRQSNALQDLKRPEHALASYDRAIVLNPDYAEAYGNRCTSVAERCLIGPFGATSGAAHSCRRSHSVGIANRKPLDMGVGQASRLVKAIPP
jgi:hypothetical protein